VSHVRHTSRVRGAVVRALAPALSIAIAPALTLAACDENKGPPPAPSAAPASPGSVAALIGAGLDGGLLEGIDPPPPAGDLKTEIEHFVNLDTCVAERAKMDPLVGDALRAIGYDTFLRDACRMLEAAHDKKRETCEKLDSSALRARCQTWVAEVANAADQCPMLLDGLPARGRAPSCVAVAGRDPRLCAAEPRLAARATCEALVLRDDAKCDPLLAPDRAVCKRELARWRSLLSPSLAGLPDLVKPSGKLVVHGADGTPDPAATDTDLAQELARGVVVVTARERARAEIGALDSDTAYVAGSPNARTRIGVALVADPDPLHAKEPKLSLDRLQIEVPGEPPLACATARCTLDVSGSQIDKTRGGQVVIKVSGTVASGGRSYKIELEAKTFVRDVVSDLSGAGRVLPPIHPLLGAFGRDGGR
jgi:hypothetical protein